MFRLLVLLVCLSAFTGAAAAQTYASVDLEDVVVCPASGAQTDFPDFSGEACQSTDLYEVDPQGRLIWMRMMLNLASDTVPQDRPLGFYVSGAMSTTIWINGREIGSNGQPGINRASEIPGQMDSVLFVPPDALRPGENEVVALMSSHHLPVNFAYPIHYLMLGDFAGPTERILRAYWPSLVTLGVFVIGFFVFGLAIRRSEDREAGLILTLLSLVISAQLIVETSRGLFGYAYPLHAWRMFAVVAFATAFGALLLAHVLKRFSGWPAPRRWIAVILSTAIVLGTNAFSPSYDPKTFFALIIPISLATVFLARASWRGPALARLYLALFVVFIATSALSINDIIDRNIYYFASGLMFLQFFDHASSLGRARRQARAEMARSQRLEMALEQARLKVEPVQLQLTSAGKLERLNTAEIVHLQAAGDYVEFAFTNGGARLFSASLNEIESRLPATFLKVHRSFIVNTAFVRSLTRDAGGTGVLTLSTGADIPVSRRVMPAVRKALTEG